MSKLHPLFHKFKAIIGYSIAIVVIITAVAVSGVRLLLTTANLYQEEVEQLASSLLLQPVKIGRMDAKLSGLIPTLIFHDVKLLSKKTKKSLFSLNRIDVGISFRDLLLQQAITPVQLTVRGMNLHLTRTVEGEFKVKGVDLAGLTGVSDDESNAFLNSWLLQQGEVAVEDSSFTWKDNQNAGMTWFFDDMNLLLKKSEQRYQLSLSAKLPKILGEKINLAIDLEGDLTSIDSLKFKSFVDSKGLNLSPLQNYVKIPDFELIGGVADVELWLNWEEQNIKQLSGDINLDDFAYRIKKRKLVVLNSVSGIFDSYKEDNNWNVSVEKFLYKSNNKFLNESNFSLAFKYNNNGFESFYLNADYLKPGTLSKIIIDNHLLSSEKEELVKHLAVNGDVRQFSVIWQNNALSSFKADFEQVGVNAWKNIPELKKLSGNVYYKNKQGSLSLFSKQSIVGFPSLFRENFKLNELSAEINFINSEQGLFFDIEKLEAKNNEVSSFSSAKLWIPKNNKSPYLDLQSHISEADIAKIEHFLPVGIMDKPLVNWLDSALVAGKLNKGTVVFNGNLNEFPFDNHEGLFSVDIETSDLTLKYMPGWPIVEKAKINGNFTGQGMKLHLQSAEVEKNIMTDSYAQIPSFIDTEVKLNLSAQGSTENVARFIVNSPVLPEAKNIVAAMRMTGDVTTTLMMNLPLGEDVSKNKSLSYTGTAKLNTAAVFMLEDKIDITETNGNVIFTDKKLSSENITANIAGEKATISVSSLTKNKGINVAAKGKIKPGVMLSRFNIPGADKVSGTTAYQANMLFPSKSSKNKYPELNIKTNLSGIKTKLPDYFYKESKSKQKLKFTTLFTGNNKIQVGIDLAKAGSAVFELDQSKKDVFLSRGAVTASSKKAQLPRKNILYIDGDFHKLSPYKWLTALNLNEKGDKQTFFVHPVVINLDKLEILLDEDKADNDIKASNPRHLPKIEGIIKKLTWDNTFLGRLDFKASKRNYGLHFDELILSARSMKLFAHGDWRYSRGKHKTNMSITLSSGDFGGMLTDLGFAAIIDKGTANTVGKIHWDASPARFSLEDLNGKIQLHIKDGNVKEVDAAAGRLLGLFSLSALPRKLFGDFKDTFKSGFSFDTASGEISIEDGDAYTEDFEISSTVAKIYVSGRTGLVDRDYENIVEVVPEVGDGLAGITALLVNLPAGIGLWLVDKITGEQFNEASTRFYEISGSWDKPEIELVEDE